MKFFNWSASSPRLQPSCDALPSFVSHSLHGDSSSHFPKKISRALKELKWTCNLFLEYATSPTRSLVVFGSFLSKTRCWVLLLCQRVIVSFFRRPVYCLNEFAVRAFFRSPGYRHGLIGVLLTHVCACCWWDTQVRRVWIWRTVQ